MEPLWREASVPQRLAAAAVVIDPADARFPGADVAVTAVSFAVWACCDDGPARRRVCPPSADSVDG